MLLNVHFQTRFTFLLVKYCSFKICFPVAVHKLQQHGVVSLGLTSSGRPEGSQGGKYNQCSILYQQDVLHCRGDLKEVGKYNQCTMFSQEDFLGDT